MLIRSKLFRLLFSVGLMRLGVVPDDPNSPPAPAPKQQPQMQTFSLEYVQELREENKSWRLKFDTVKQELADANTAVAKTKTNADDAIKAAGTAADARILQSELKAHAVKAGLVDLDALKLADLSKVKLNDKGEAEGADVLFTELKTAKPYLFGAANSSTPNTPPANTPPGQVKATEIKDPVAYKAAEAAFLKQNK